MIIEDSKGNIFNVELMLEVENDSSELRLLATALYEKLKLIKSEDIYGKYVEIIEHATGGRMSKCYLDTSIVKAIIDDNVSQIVEDEIREFRLEQIIKE